MPRGLIGTVPPARQFSRVRKLFDTPRRAIPSVPHRGLVGDASALAAKKEPDLVISAIKPGVEHPGGTVTFGSREDQISPAIISLAPLAVDGL